MKKKNNHGFTMVELLATITIIGILAAVAIPAVYRYAIKSRKVSGETMTKSSYEAAENYIVDTGIILKKRESITIEISELVELQYLEPLYDPANNGAGGKRCDEMSGSVVKVTRKDEPAGYQGLPIYEYKVTIKCPQTKDTFSGTFPE